MTDKRAIRSKIKAKKATLSPVDIDLLSRDISDKVINTEEFRQTKAVYIYMEYNQEVITKEIIREALKQGKKVAIPKVCDGNMDFYYLTDIRNISIGFKGILEPTESIPAHDPEALMIMPGVAYDKTFNRIGYGGGYYDRYLNETNPNTKFIKMGLCYPFQIIDEFEPEEHDNKVDLLITPEHIINSEAEELYYQTHHRKV